MTAADLLVGAGALLWSVFAIAAVRFPSPRVRATAVIPFLAHAGWIVWRVILTGHAPFATLYESLICFSLLLELKALILIRRQSGPAVLPYLLPGIAVLLVAFILPGDLKVPGNLMPALQSFWIFIHVPAIFYAYVSLTFALGSSLVTLLGKKETDDTAQSELKQAFFFLTLGIITGAFWAQASWGAFWSWDPKETWALATWLLTGLAMHLRSRRARTVVLGAAFAAMLFTYFGVTFLLPGLHSYLK